MSPSQDRTRESNQTATSERLLEDIRVLSHRLLQFANRGRSKIDFLRDVSLVLLDSSNCDEIELWIRRENGCYHGRAKNAPQPCFSLESISSSPKGRKAIPCASKTPDFAQLCEDIFDGVQNSTLPCFTKAGSFWTGDLDKTLTQAEKQGEQISKYGLFAGEGCRSLAVIKIVVAGQEIGLLVLKSKSPDFFSHTDLELYETISQSLGIAVLNERAQAALRERIKELTCLYEMAKIAERPDKSLGEMLQAIVKVLPPAWQYPESASARIILDGQSYSADGFKESSQKQAAEIIVNAEMRGVIEIVYLQEEPDLDEGPFLKEERSLIDAVATQVGLIVERKEAEEEKARLQEQLRHADRLATIGQLAAGVAHELNEPLGNILGFAQLAKKNPGLPDQASKDIEKIITSSLHAREVIRKLTIFARQMPTKKAQVNLNDLVEEGLYFLSSRCAKAGIELVRSLSPDLPPITADSAQMHQVLVNLVVNAIQAMPNGGRLSIGTLAADDQVSLVVEDTGIGMSEDVLKKIFIPFFTTKDVNEGTGLGLAVVHGIITSHGGSIKVESQVNKGSRFIISLPVRPPEEEKESSPDG